jgi:hypothetical protein
MHRRHFHFQSGVWKWRLESPNSDWPLEWVGVGEFEIGTGIAGTLNFLFFQLQIQNQEDQTISEPTRLRHNPEKSGRPESRITNIFNIFFQLFKICQNISLFLENIKKSQNFSLMRKNLNFSLTGKKSQNCSITRQKILKFLKAFQHFR